MGNERRRWKEESAKRRDKGEEETFFLGNTHEPSGQAISKAVSFSSSDCGLNAWWAVKLSEGEREDYYTTLLVYAWAAGLAG